MEVVWVRCHWQVVLRVRWFKVDYCDCGNSCQVNTYSATLTPCGIWGPSHCSQDLLHSKDSQCLTMNHPPGSRRKYSTWCLLSTSFTWWGSVHMYDWADDLLAWDVVMWGWWSQYIAATSHFCWYHLAFPTACDSDARSLLAPLCMSSAFGQCRAV